MDKKAVRKDVGPQVTRMRVFSSMPIKRKDEGEENKKHATRVAKIFIEYCCWKSMAPLALSLQVPPIPIRLKLVKENYTPPPHVNEIAVADLYTLATEDGSIVIWNPTMETRSHVRLGSVTATSVIGIKHRISVIESSERTWVRSIHNLWFTTSGGKATYFTMPELSHLRFVDNEADNADIVSSLRDFSDKMHNLTAVGKKVDAKSIIKLANDLLPNYFLINLQTRLVVADLPDDASEMGHAPEAEEVEGGELRDPNIELHIVKDMEHSERFQIEFRVYINNNMRGHPRRSPDDILTFFQVYFYMLLASFVRDAYPYGPDETQ